MAVGMNPRSGATSKAGLTGIIFNATMFYSYAAANLYEWLE